MKKQAGESDGGYYVTLFRLLCRIFLPVHPIVNALIHVVIFSPWTIDVSL